MLSAQDNELLPRVGADAPRGEIMRRLWVPPCRSEEVPERDRAPVHMRLLGEDPVAFHDTNGRLGAVGAPLPRRRTP